jgi:hypothetical protein
MSTESAICERTWHAVAPDNGGEGPVTFAIAAPRQQPTGEWGVAVSFGGIEPPVWIFGEDSWQAVDLGMRFVAARVEDLCEKGWAFFCTKGGARANPADLRAAPHAP